MDYTLISSDQLITDYIRKYGSDSIDESMMRAVMDDTLSKIVPKSTKKMDIVIIDIDKFKGRLPKNYVSDIQAVFRVKPLKYEKTTISEIRVEVPGIKCHTEVTIKCPLCHQDNCWCGKPVAEIDTDLIWRMSNPEHVAAMSHFFSDFYNPEKAHWSNINDNRFYLMNRTTDNWFAIKYYAKECTLVDNKVKEYRIVDGNIITNFEEGEVMLAYFGEYLDENGYRKVPNVPRVIEALTTAVLHANIARKYYTTLTQDLRLALDRLDMKLEREILRARVELDMPEYNEVTAICQNILRKMYDPYYWYSGGMKQPDQYNPSNQYNFKSRL